MTPQHPAPSKHSDAKLPTRSKIVATIGPGSDAPETIRKLIEAGVSVFRFNFSHGVLDAHKKRLNTLRAVASDMKATVAVLGDLCGPKIRVGAVPKSFAPKTPLNQGGGVIDLSAGQDVLFRTDVAEAMVQTERSGDLKTPVFPVTYPEMITEVEPGHRVLINDGAIRMLAVEKAAGTLRCRVTQGGPVTSGKGINLPDSEVSAPAITPVDWQCVEWAVEQRLDFLALSFVRRPQEVHALKRRLEELCGLSNSIPVISKIEKPQAVADLDAIIEASDAIMVARGDLGVEMDIAQVPVVQKLILARCQYWGRPCIVATQMLESMITAASPTRAEASDVANAIFDGADAVMLSGETAVGKHPALVVETMRRIIAAAESSIADSPHSDSPPLKLVETRYPTAALAHGAWHIAKDVGAKLVVCWSQAGGTARYLSQNDFRIPIVAYTSDPEAARRMALLKGVTPVLAAPPVSGLLRDFTDMAERDMLARGWVHQAEPIILLAGKPLGEAKATNSIATLFVGDPNGGFRSHRS
jgi:pyruvate kinase